MMQLADLDSPREILDDVAALRTGAADRERALLIRATEWADAHPALDPSESAWDDEIDYERHLPPVLWTAVPEFAAALGMRTDAGRSFLMEALEARQRLPLCWRALKAGEVDAWRLRRIAERTLAHPDEIATHVDKHVARIAGRVGVVKVDKLIDEAMMRFHPEEWHARQQELLDRRYVKLFDQISHNGVAHMEIRGDLADLYDFNESVAIIAAKLAELGDTDSLDVRRSKAVGLLADPQTALDLLATPKPAPPAEADAPPAPPARTKPRKQIVLHVHLSESAIWGGDDVGRLERGDQPITESLIRSWCGRTDANLKVYPVRDLNDHHGVGQYEIPDRLSSQVDLIMHTCVFPWCTRKAKRCDKDHTVPYDQGGATCLCNLAPLCRRHHRLKTHTAWRYEPFELGTYVWTSPLGRQYLRDNTGTSEVTPPSGPPPPAPDPPGSGCWHADPSG
jgi:hypothetical protein